MKVLVVGTGRSGTGWCSRLLQSAGLNVGHEGVFGPEQAAGATPIDWYGLDGDASWLAVPLLPVADTRAVLVVRHPLDVVASLVHIDFLHRPLHSPYRDVAAAHVDLTGPPLDALLRFWICWNAQAASHVDTTFTLDALVAGPTRLPDWANAPRPPAPAGPVNTRTEWKHGPRPTLTWDQFDPTLARRACSDWQGYRKDN